ncbi:hypothetical protein BCR33DRAFT_788369 [Rhizoclosmatium globosum]|uniref:RanBP2-type domain-containing protein n=1 Tax=Rhizoclosmatium globosum TaxID=329046 RepID=A0A1Y2BX67_9FUNG|nr:hypothetical protein BCR33DRAFT_788369 [Rhizoclosmatium globosum]|eukprot:ORY39360.1 hypothetical protein BCR33DRAFT_788369 [Rhizoclosmatium globosum]
MAANRIPREGGAAGGSNGNSRGGGLRLGGAGQVGRGSGSLRGGRGGSGSGRGGGFNGGGRGIQEGDWPCVQCGASNFARRIECFRCHAKKDGSKDAGGIEPFEISGNGGGSGSSSSGGSGGGSGGGRPRVKGGNPFVSPLANDLPRFLATLSRAEPKDLTPTIHRFEAMWLLCWRQPQSLPAASLGVLLAALSRLPASSDVDPPAISEIENVFDIVFDSKNRPSNPDVKRVEMSIDVVNRLQKFLWREDRSEVKGGLENVLSGASSCLAVKFPDHRKAQGKINDLLEQLEKPWTIKVAEVMHIPGGLGNGTYQSPEEYFDTVFALMVAITFEQGNQSLSPVCRMSEKNGECGKVLRPCSSFHTSSGGTLHCMGHGCSSQVVLACSDKRHNRGLCSTHANQARSALLAGPSNHASTHIYDGFVAKVSFDGRVFLRDVLSRRPPLKEIHWRTTRRLQSPNLVGLVKLNSRGAKLNLNQTIVWAEIVEHSRDPRDREDEKRKNGFLACSILQLEDVFNSTGPQDALFQAGDFIAVIDCQSFVPEQIPVLKALELQRNSLPLPFQNGALLNISTQKRAETAPSEPEPLNDIDDNSSEDDNMLLLGHDIVVSDKTRLAVETLVHKSLLDPIIQIRRHAGNRRLLENRLMKLVESATLDEGQFESFVGSLIHPVHCTQGPPGTGKSYLGVVIARALLIIRELWIKTSPSVSAPPILVLSYKNHAIDEFLCDLVAVEPFISLIRIGSIKDDRLRPFAENTWKQESAEVKQAKAALERLHELSSYLENFYQSKLSFGCTKDVIFGLQPTTPEEEKSARQASYDATSQLAEALAWLAHFSTVFPTLATKVEVIDPHAISMGQQNGWVFDYTVLDSLLHNAKNKKVLPLSAIQSLFDGIQHYNPGMDSLEVLYHFIMGFTPQPLCYYPAGCSEISEPGSRYCLDHQCVSLTMSGSTRCMNSVVMNKSYCQDHACFESECQLGKLLENGIQQNYCDMHACRICVSMGFVADIGNDEPPRNTCDKHPLCAAIIKETYELCSNLTELNSPYCVEHAPRHCQGLTKRGNPCTQSALSKEVPFCNNHVPMRQTSLAVSSVTQSDGHVSNVKCQSLTAKGKPCKGNTAPGAIYCPDHSKNPKLQATNDQKWEIYQPVAAQPKEVLTETIDVIPPPAEPETKGVVVEYELDSFAIELDDFELVEDAEAVFNDNPDELEEEAENIQHLREVFEVGSDTALFEMEEPLKAATEQVSELNCQTLKYVPPGLWEWNMSLDERWNACQSAIDLIGAMKAGFERMLSSELEKKKREYHHADVRARSKVYEGKSVIGGTIVGCISRLDAIRVTNPFAIIVEEASEVLEPLLFACLGTSTAKLELVGDHFQLQPSMMNKFEFERINKMNMSLFERLIRAPTENQIPQSVLSIQRRMRPNIADLTREFYAEITSITDHAKCLERRIGDDLVVARGKVKTISNTDTKGWLVPGISSNVFFWTHDGKEERAAVGLSKVNHVEAKMCNVVYAIITPYKGQLMEIRKTLEKPPFNLVTFKDPKNSVVLSTVDRFQGDESDIIIASLVIDSKSTSPFVKQQNRMIVLNSRARIGFYIVGNPAYFDRNPVSHWKTTIDRLIEPAPLHMPGSKTADELVWSESRLGRGILPNLPVVSPCANHPTNIACSKLFALAKLSSKMGLEAARENFNCDVKVELQLPCTHTVKLACSVENSIASGVASFPTCTKPALTSFIHPLCKHEITGNCNIITGYSVNPTSAPNCIEEVEYTPPCGHSLKVKCYLKHLYEQSSALFVCPSKVEIELPRCGHSTLVSCQQAVTLQTYFGIRVSNVGEVIEGTVYGPKDATCAQKVEFIRVCGHNMTLTCEKAFSLTPALSPCNFKENAINPSCGHAFDSTCSEKRALEAKIAGSLLPTPVAVVKEEINAIESESQLELDDSFVTQNFGMQMTASAFCSQTGTDVFIERKLQLLNSFKGWVEELPTWGRPLFSGRYVSGFITMKKQPTGLVIGSLATQQTYYGVMVRLWTPNNLQKIFDGMSDGQSTYLLLVSGYIMNVLSNPSGIPNSSQQKGAALREWHFEQSVVKHHDAMQLSASGFDTVVFWTPFCMQSTGYVVVTKADLKQILLNRRFPTYDLENFALKKIEFKIPVIGDSVNTSAKGTGASSFLSPDVASSLDGTLAEGCSVYRSWDGVSIGLGNSLLPSVQKELRIKLSFILKAAKQAIASPFAGLSYLESLRETFNIAEFSLIHALELCEVGSKEDAEDQLVAYIDTVRTAEAHPLLLLAVSRIAVKEKIIRITLLRSFLESSTLAESWLLPDENVLLSEQQVKVSQPATTPREMWNVLKQKHHCKSEAMEELIDLVGLTKVKVKAIELFKTAIGLQKMAPDIRKANMMALNYSFYGNPGTGKTTVARLFAKILKDSGMRSSDTFIQTSARKLKDEGADKFMSETVPKATNGVLFIDEAYTLSPIDDPKGREIVNELLLVTEDMRDKISVIIAGYEDDLNDKFFAFNDGLKSRFQEIVFEDFDQPDLLSIWYKMVIDRGWTADDRIGPLVTKKLAKMTGRKGFGNARAVRAKFEEYTKRAFSRESYDGEPLLILEDVIGESPLQNQKLKNVLAEFEERIGWVQVKKTVNELVSVCEKNYERELNGLDASPVILNRLFLGNPGTGKTTCAQLYGRLLKHLNFLSKGEVTEATASDLIGSHVGESQRKTNAMLEKARGNVLLIDEAYNLDDNHYGKQVLDVLVEKVQGSENDDIAVLLCGYDEPMLKMLRTQNPGLSRRFPREYAFEFADYTDSELLDLFNFECRKKRIAVESFAVKKRAIEVLSKQRNLPNFGNAGAVKNLLVNAISKASARQTSGHNLCLKIEDFGNDQPAASKDPLEALNKLYRIDKVKQSLIEIRDSYAVALKEGGELPNVSNFVFTGSPGTGKTTVARVMAQVLFEMGILSTNRLVETSGLGLTGEFVGHTKKRVEEKLGEARGGVLFIDEAYELGKGHFADEALTSIVAAMTNPMYKGIVIIIAGYTSDINDMLNANAGLKSRFTNYFEFEDWKPEDCYKYFSDRASEKNFVIQADVQEPFLEGMKTLIGLDGWGNGRDVTKLWEAVLIKRSSRVVANPEPIEKTITLSDVQTALDTMISPRKISSSRTKKSRYSSMPLYFEELRKQFKAPPPPQEKVHMQEEYKKSEFSSRITEIVEEIEEEGEIEIEEKHEVTIEEYLNTPIGKDGRDSGVSDEVWAELEESKQRRRNKLEKIRKELEEIKRLADERERERLRQEMETKIRAKMKEEQAVQEKIRRLCPCPVGFSWFKAGNGWRCGGGSHFVSDAKLRESFMV